MTVVLGLPIPFTSTLLLVVVGIHVVMGLACVVSGAIAILSYKGRGRHSTFGTIYYWCLAGVVGTATVLAIARWGEDYHLFILGVLSIAAAYFGRAAMRRSWQGNARLHISGMGLSYILLLTAFYVDNGKSLPVWRDLPTLAYWILPSAVGLPIMLYALLRHRLVRGAQ